MHENWTDQSLVSYLDGQLDPTHHRELEIQMSDDPAIAARLKVLSVDTAGIREAFDNTLASAPSIDISQLHRNRLVARSPVRKPEASSRSSRLLPMAASVLVALGVGLFAGLNAESWLANDTNDTLAAWQQAVVDYQVLYVPDTLPAVAPNQASKQLQLAAVSRSSGLSVTDQMTNLPGIDFRRAQTLGLNGSPLVQIAFADSKGQPVALCFTRVNEPASAPVSRTIDGMNAVTWRNGKYGFIIVGFSDPDLLSVAAEKAAKLF